jgi:hypothetical protein
LGGTEVNLKRIAVYLYITNLSLLITHEIDSAYWHEWKLFNLPGGIDLFLILNFLLITVFLIGLVRVLEWKKYAYLFYILLAISGIFAFFIHSYFIFSGHPEFDTPVSWAVLILILIASITQIIVHFLLKRKLSDN